MSYHLLSYIAIFLPVVIVVYQCVPKSFRWKVILAADYLFFYMISGKLLIYLLFATLVTFFTGRRIGDISEKDTYSAKEQMKVKRKILALGIVINLSILVSFKYLGIFGIHPAAPIGISYYTLQTISYMVDAYRGVIKPDRNIARVALYLSFFPQIMEGPISRFSETADSLYAGEDIKYRNLTFGYQRILWGLSKKMIIADRLAPFVSKVFGGYQKYDGMTVMMGAVCFTCQLYMEFSGCMDIIMGSGQIFGIHLPENFRQPFFADSASDFWHRWHITLGTWLKDYIFYPVSLAKPVKKIGKKVKNLFGRQAGKFTAPTIALFVVWTFNGLWHGPKSTYIFYGMFYFVLIFIENITEEPVRKLTEKLHIDRHARWYKMFKILKLLIIVNIGEMFFRAESVSAGFLMLRKIIFHFRPSGYFISNLGLGADDFVIVLLGVLLVMIVDVLHEKNILVRERVNALKLPVRWGVWYAAIMFVVIFGAYGAGYTVTDMIYASY